jgi:hypothetical protein
MRLAVFVSIAFLADHVAGVTNFNQLGIDCSEICLTEALASSTTPAETLRLHTIVKMINGLKEIRIRNGVHKTFSTLRTLNQILKLQSLKKDHLVLDKCNSYSSGHQCSSRPCFWVWPRWHILFSTKLSCHHSLYYTSMDWKSVFCQSIWWRTSMVKKLPSFQLYQRQNMSL